MGRAGGDRLRSHVSLEQAVAWGAWEAELG